MKKWEILNSDEVIKNKWITVKNQTCKTSDGKIIKDYFIIEKSDYVILIIEDHGEIFFAEQYRHGIGDIIINLPMGFIDKGETKEEAARREMIEETGCGSDSIEFLGSFYQSPSYTPTKAYVFYTNKITKKGNIESDDEEEIKLIKIPKNKVREMIEKNEIKDMSTLSALLLAKDKLFV